MVDPDSRAGPLARRTLDRAVGWTPRGWIHCRHAGVGGGARRGVGGVANAGAEQVAGGAGNGAGLGKFDGVWPNIFNRYFQIIIINVHVMKSHLILRVIQMSEPRYEASIFEIRVKLMT